MDLFPDHQHVWLRSRVHGTYLRADGDGHVVSLSPSRASMKTAWTVHRYYMDDHHVLLHNAANGRYLAATLDPAPSGFRGFRVEQRTYDDLDEESIRWEPISISPDAAEIIIRHYSTPAGHYGYLRANGKYLPWNETGVTVDNFFNVSNMFAWMVVPIPTRERIPPLPRPSGLDLLRGRLSVLLPSREVMFIGDGADDFSLTFRGRSVHRLRNEIAIRLGIPKNVANNSLVMYVRAGTYGRFTPLVVDLPSSRQPLTIRAEMSDNGPRYPDFE